MPHIYFPDEYDGGDLHIHIGGSVQVVEIGAQSSNQTGPDMQEMLRRFRDYGVPNNAESVLNAMTADGWAAQAGTKRSPYIRLTYIGSRRRASMYLNTSSLSTNGLKLASFTGSLDGADQRGASVYFHHRAGEHAALTAANEVRLWCDGKRG